MGERKEKREALLKHLNPGFAQQQQQEIIK